MIRRALAHAAKFATKFPVRPEAMPPSMTRSIHSKTSVIHALRSVHGLKLPFRAVRSIWTYNCFRLSVHQKASRTNPCWRCRWH